MASTTSSTKLSPHLDLWRSNVQTLPENRGRRNTLVVLFPWLYATPKAISKYCELYHERGLDVLTVSCQLKHFLWPSTARSVATELLDYLGKNDVPLNTDRFLVHAFSVGAYVYTITLMELAAGLNKPHYDVVREKIRGQIFDSIVVGSLGRMANGIANMADNQLSRWAVVTMAMTYFTLTRPFTVKFYDKAVDFFFNRPPRCPTLFYYCLNDPMADPRSMDELFAVWRDTHGMDVTVKCWERSLHAGHLREHPEQYRLALEGYLRTLQFGYDRPSKAHL